LKYYVNRNNCWNINTKYLLLLAEYSDRISNLLDNQNV